MGSIETYNHKTKEWIPYLPDYKKWTQHFADLSAGRVRPDYKGRFIVGSGSRFTTETPQVELGTPVAQTLEMAKSELKREKQKVIRGKKRRRSYNQLDQQ